MGKQHRLLLAAGAPGLGARAAGALRPGVEALLLAAVALGCAQAGWSLLTPNAARALNATSDNREDRVSGFAEVRSPFAPEAADLEGASHALAALVSSIELVGVRVSAGDLPSGAMFAMADGGQRAFVVGQQIADGVTLANVDADYVLLAYDGGQRRLAMSAGPSYSFARAMMGLEPAPGAPPAPSPEAAAAPTPDAHAWAGAALGQIEVSEGAARGWRIGEGAPQAALDAGLRAGDLIVAVNGAGPERLADVAAAIAAGRVELAVERGGERVTVIMETNGRL